MTPLDICEQGNHKDCTVLVKSHGGQKYIPEPTEESNLTKSSKRKESPTKAKAVSPAKRSSRKTESSDKGKASPRKAEAEKQSTEAENKAKSAGDDELVTSNTRRSHSKSVEETESSVEPLTESTLASSDHVSSTNVEKTDQVEQSAGNVGDAIQHADTSVTVSESSGAGSTGVIPRPQRQESAEPELVAKPSTEPVPNKQNSQDSGASSSELKSSLSTSQAEPEREAKYPAKQAERAKTNTSQKNAQSPPMPYNSTPNQPQSVRKAETNKSSKTERSREKSQVKQDSQQRPRTSIKRDKNTGRKKAGATTRSEQRSVEQQSASVNPAIITLSGGKTVQSEMVSAGVEPSGKDNFCTVVSAGVSEFVVTVSSQK